MNDLPLSFIARNLTVVREQIADSVALTGRDPDSVSLVAVSKTWPVDFVAAAVDSEQLIFGENKVQELTEKVPALENRLIWHLIGHLQKNKVRKALQLADCIETVDSVDLATRISVLAGELGDECRGKTGEISVLLQVNVAEDDAKFGFSIEELLRNLDALCSLPNLKIDGLMTIPAFDPDPEKSRPAFARLRELRDECLVRTGLALPVLSMGMSHDFTVAVEEGATLVRVGSAIFGNRNYS